MRKQVLSMSLSNKVIQEVGITVLRREAVLEKLDPELFWDIHSSYVIGFYDTDKLL
jgi:hypothetical protein